MSSFDAADRELQAASERLADRVRTLATMTWLHGGMHEGSRRHATQILAVCWARRERASRARTTTTEAALAAEMRAAAEAADRTVERIDVTIRHTSN